MRRQCTGTQFHLFQITQDFTFLLIQEQMEKEKKNYLSLQLTGHDLKK